MAIKVRMESVIGFETVAEFLEAAEPANKGVEGVLGVGGAGVGDDENL